MSKEFEGFRSRQKLEEYTGVPNEVFDEIMSQLTGTQFKILMAIFRKTYGWAEGADENGNAIYKVEDNIAQSQLMEMTGVSRNTVKKHLNKLIEKGLIVKVEDYQKGINRAAKYRIKQKRASKSDSQNNERVSNVDSRNPKRVSKSDSRRVSKSDSQNNERVSNVDSRNPKRVSKSDSRRVSKFDSTKESIKESSSSKEKGTTTLPELEKYISQKVGRVQLSGLSELIQALEEHGANKIKKATDLAVKSQKNRKGKITINSYKYIIRFIDDISQESNSGNSKRSNRIVV